MFGLRIRKKLHAFKNSVSGGMAVVLAGVTPILVGAAGLATDYAMYSHRVTTLQAAVDAAAIGAAQEMALASSKDSTIESVAKAFVANATENRSGVMTTVSVDRKKNSLRVNVVENWQPAFSEFFGVGLTPIQSHAGAALVGATSICVLTLDPNKIASFRLESTARLIAGRCGTYSNSIHRQGAWFGLGSRVQSGLNCSAGGVVAASWWLTPKPVSDCPIIPDPLVGRSEPKAGTCDFIDFSVTTGIVRLKAGTYCGGINISGTANVTFESGTYIFKDGPFHVAGNATITGEDVGFYLSGDKSLINFIENTTVNLSGPIGGDLAGLLFFESRSNTLNLVHRIASARADILTGTIYLPRGRFIIDPNGPISARSAYTAIVSNQLLLTRGPELYLNTDYASTDVPVPDGIKIAGDDVVLVE